MRLSGQPIGRNLARACSEVEREIGKPLQLRDTKLHPDYPKFNPRGHHQQTNNAEIIWVRGDLQPPILEAVVAHELMHVLQKARLWPTTATSPTCPPEIKKLSVGINSLVKDPIADIWASNRGFGIRADLLEQINANVQTLTSGRKAEPSFTWDSITSSIERAYQGLQNQVIKVNLALLEIIIKYAGIRLRCRALNTSDYVAFDKALKRNFPTVREFGQTVRDLVDQSGYDSPERCLDSMKAVIAHLSFPTDAIAIKTQLTQALLWPTLNQ